jgi:hypothetical protein
VTSTEAGPNPAEAEPSSRSILAKFVPTWPSCKTTRPDLRSTWSGGDPGVTGCYCLLLMTVEKNEVQRPILKTVCNCMAFTNKPEPRVEHSSQVSSC